MSKKILQIALASGMIIAMSITLFQGCGKMTGENYPNQPPTVELVNVPPSADSTTLTQVQKMPFKIGSMDTWIPILSLEGAAMVANSERVYRADSNGTIEYVSGNSYTIDYNYGTSGHDAVLKAISGGSPEMVADTSLIYFIDFSFNIDNYYVITYAPTVHWVGYDPDGFVDHYRYADITSPTFISAFKNATLPQTPTSVYNQFKNDPTIFTWKDTTAVSARIYLLTNQGEVTEHLLFLQSVDNKGAISEGMVYKTFYRTNNAPNNPVIKPQDRPESEFALNYTIPDTLFCLDQVTPLWAGISFNWRATDPDDKELYTIPLQYSYYLIRTPGDTLWEWSNPNWNNSQLVTLSGLETGSYLFSVWTRDDGLALCSQPATAAFKVVRPSFEHHILIVDETQRVTGLFENTTPDAPRNFYLSIFEDLQNELSSESIQMDGVDVRIIDNSIYTSPTVQTCPIPYALIGQYRLIFIFGDAGGFPSVPTAAYRANRNTVLADYLDIGGNVWVEGRHVLQGLFGLNPGINDMNLSGTPPRILSNYFQLIDGFATNPAFEFQGSEKIEFLGAVPQVPNMPTLTVDSLRAHEINVPINYPRNAIPEVDWFTRSNDAVTLYAFNSITADTSLTNPLVDSLETGVVIAGATPTQCWIKPHPDQLLEVYRIARKVDEVNYVEAEVQDFNADSILVSYPYGQPWAPSDSILVNYKYDPISQMHLKPVAVRYEAQPRVLNTIEIQGIPVNYYTYTLGYRTSIFAFPIYYMCDESGQTYNDVKAMMKEMLDWYFYPTIHWQL